MSTIFGKTINIMILIDFIYLGPESEIILVHIGLP